MASVVPTHKWNLPEGHRPESEPLARELGVPPLVARLLAGRGLGDAALSRAFLEPLAAHLHRPDTMPDIAKATSRILAAIERHERILVCGDYDVDGVTGTALLCSVLTDLGAESLSYLPHRETEGYGLSLQAVRFGSEHICRLIVTNDCGISDFDAVAAANAAGIDVVVTDHHEPGDRLPDALAVVNPKRTDSAYPFRELCGCGVAFKLAWSLLRAAGRDRGELNGVLDLVGLGTIADIVPLLGENRILARLGLKSIRLSRRPGLRALLEVAGLRKDELTSRDVSFGLAPRINAAGRVGHAGLALRLLLTADLDEARTIARELEGLNRSRQSLEETILNDAVRQIESDRLHERRVMVIPGDSWHQGVIGIVASKLVDRYWRPSIVVALDGETGRGSGRSLTGFDLHAALSACSDHLISFGGHRYAAGLTVRRDRLGSLSEALNAFADAVPESVFQPTLHVEAIAELTEIDSAFLTALNRLEPFGPDNPEPLFAALGLEVVGYPRRVGKDHLKFRVRSGAAVMEAIAWGRSSEILNIEIGRKGHLDICFCVRRDSWQGRPRIQLELLDLRSSTTP